MDAKSFYNTKVEELNQQLKILEKKKSAFGILRFGSVVAIILSFYFLWSLGIWFAIIAAIILLIIFTRLLFADLKNKSAINHINYLIKINKDELNFLEGEFHQFADGSEHIHEDHFYANDLDIFGRASLFQYLNRTTSEMGNHTLAAYLKSPAPIELILERQEGVKELSKKIDWIQELQAKGKEERITFSAQQKLEKWINEPPVFLQYKPWKWLRYLLPAIILTIVILYAADIISTQLFYFSLFVFAAIAYQINKHVAPIHNQLSGIVDELEVLSLSIKHIENENFSADLLKHLQSAFIHDQQKASKSIFRLYKLLERLDMRYNIVISIPLNILFQWNLQQVLDLEKWKSSQKKNFHLWFNSLGHFEALNSFAILSFNESDWSFPQITPEYFSIEAKYIGHPLIAANKRVRNNISIQHAGELMLVTGSNMAGKSTYLRSVGVNIVLAMAGSTVCALLFKVSHVQLISSMRIADNLSENTSTFYAELKKLKTIIDKVNAKEKVFILLDEILRGTNSLDRHTGSVAFMKQLIKHNAAAIIATHDLELAKLKEMFPENIINYHFDVQVSNDELYFDYKLKPGVCNSLNASILMKKIGIEL